MSPSAPSAHPADGVQAPTSGDGHSLISTTDAVVEREATELHNYNSNSELNIDGSGTRSDQPGDGPRLAGKSSALKMFWKRQVAATVPQESCRDHFAIERTYLGYFRTSLALAFLGVFIAQLFRLQHTEHHDPVFGYFVLGIPLSCLCTGAAICVNLLGACRFWRQQNAVLRGKVLSGGWEILATLAVVLVITLLIFVLVVAVDIRKTEPLRELT